MSSIVSHTMCYRKIVNNLASVSWCTPQWNPISWSYPLFPPWGSSPRNAKTSTNLSFPKRLQDTLAYNSVLEGIPRIIVREMGKDRKKVKQRLWTKPRANLPGISVMLLNSFIVISNKEQRHCSIFVFYLLSFTCDGLYFIGKSELPYVHLEIPSLARNNHQVEMKAT